VRRRSILLALAALTALPAPALADRGSRFREPVVGDAVVATESPAAARVGRDVLADGGNAIDAAVATAFAIGVARPQSCGIGGGGFLLYRSHTGRVRSLDFREFAPAAFRARTLSPPGLHKQLTGHLTVGVPGTVAGLAAALERYGTLPLREALAPAERLARKGFRVPRSLSAAMAENASRLRLFEAAARQYLVDGRRPYAAGERLRQPELAASLRRIQRGGADAFYRGVIARRVVRDMRAPRPRTGDPGLLTLKDFAAYRPRWRTPLFGSYRGRQVLAIGPPSSGGIAVLEALNILQTFDLRAAGQSSADALHLIAEAQKIVFADRNAYVADPEFVPVPTGPLTSRLYAGARRTEIDLGRAKTYGPGLGSQPEAGPPPRGARAEGTTTHISVVDARGSAVALTCTIEQEFGSAVVAPGTGFLLNNELTDFSAPGTANQPGPRKRPRSSIAPTIVVSRGGRPVMVLGAAGGVRIIGGVLLPIVQYVDFDQGLDGAVDAERIDASSGQLRIEHTRVEPAVVAELERRGHVLVREGEYAARPRVQVAGVGAAQPGLDPSRTRVALAVSDPRTDDGSLAVGR
jgi:gamma-glutamyltranspeptidase/glutathione hydrolase